jgi:putative hydrolase of the HAD superfamily
METTKPSSGPGAYGLRGSMLDVRGWRPEAVLLDAAGTLIRPREPVGETYAGMARRFGAKLDPELLSRAFPEVLADMPDLAFAWTSTAELQSRELDWWRTLVGRVLTRVGGSVRDFDGFFDSLYRYYAEGCVWECFPEVSSALTALQAQGCRLAVVSNFDSRLPGILNDLGLADSVDAIIYSSKAGSAKPDPAIFQAALAALRVSHEAAIHVGDSPQADVAGAAAAGIAGLLIRRGYVSETGFEQATSEGVIGSLTELLPAIP